MRLTRTTLWLKACVLVAICMTMPTASALTGGKEHYGEAKTSDSATRLPLATEPVMDY